MLVSCARDDNEKTPRTRPYEITLERFGRQIRALRRSRGLTQERLAERSDLSTDAIRRIERGRLSPSLTTIGKLGRGLQLSASTLLLGAEQRTRPITRELAEFIAARTPKERALAWRVMRALFDDEPT